MTPSVISAEPASSCLLWRLCSAHVSSYSVNASALLLVSLSLSYDARASARSSHPAPSSHAHGIPWVERVAWEPRAFLFHNFLVRCILRPSPWKILLSFADSESCDSESCVHCFAVAHSDGRSTDGTSRKQQSLPHQLCQTHCLLLLRPCSLPMSAIISFRRRSRAWKNPWWLTTTQGVLYPPSE